MKQSIRPQGRGATALLIIGVALLSAGAYSVLTLFSSLFARYLYVEDLALGFDEATMFAVTRATSIDRGILIAGLLLAFLGLAALVVAAVRHRRSRRARAATA